MRVSYTALIFMGIVVEKTATALPDNGITTGSCSREIRVIRIDRIGREGGKGGIVGVTDTSTRRGYHMYHGPRDDYEGRGNGGAFFHQGMKVMRMA